MKWLRLYNEILDDPKIMLMDEKLRWRYVSLLILANNDENRGHLPNDENIEFKMRITHEEWIESKDEFKKRGLIEANGNIYEIHGFSKRQYDSDSSKERTREYRERHKDVTVTPPEPEPEPDTETETDTRARPEPESNKKAVAGLVNSILKKSSGNRNNGSDKSIFIGLLIRIGIKKPIALNFVERYGLDYLARKIIQFEYIKTTDKELENPIGYLRTIIEHDKYPPPEEFFEYAKNRAEKLIESNVHEMQVLGSYL